MSSIMRRLVPLIVVVAVIFGAYRWWIGQAAANDGALSASGTIEATEVSVSAETTGRVKMVMAGEGDHVQAGQTLVQLDDGLIQAQRKQSIASVNAALGAQAAAQASHAAAQAQLDQLKAGARPQEIAAEQQAVLAAQGKVTTAEGQLAQAHGALEAAQAQRDQAVAGFAQVKQGARPEVIDAALVKYEQASAAVRQAQSNYDKVAGQPNVGALPQSLALQDATLALEAAKSNYEGQLKGATTPEIDQARAGVDQAAAGVVQASAAVSQTEAALETARAGLAGEQARLDLLQAGSRPEQIQAAAAQVAASRAQSQAAAAQAEAAQAAVNLIDEQIARLAIKAPSDGVVLSRAIEPGEMALAGGQQMVVSDLGHLTITVYLPEDRYGEVKLGDQARVGVDSFPDQTFTATVTRIADQAEFTPRNVQTPAGRRTTVFAVKLEVANRDGMLKPGMPADVVFGQ